MAKISSYSFATPPSLGDYVIGTQDVTSKNTKNFRISDVLALAGSGVYVPYTGASGPVNLGSNSITAGFIIRAGGQSDEFLKADGSIDTNTYITTSYLSNYVPYTGANSDVDLDTYNITANSFVKLSGMPNQFLKADGSVDTNTYLTTSLAGSTYVPYTGASTDVSLGLKSLSGFDITASNSLNANGPFKVSNNAGTSGQILVSQGSGGAPIWQDSADAVDMYKGSFYDVLTQTAAAANTAYAMIYRQTDVDATFGVTLANGTLGYPTRVTVSHTGVYNVAFSGQFVRTSGGTAQSIDIWLRKNGVNVSNTNTKLTLQSNSSYIVAAWNFFIKLNAGEYVELMWAVSDTNIIMTSEAATALHPATPSVILTINQI